MINPIQAQNQTSFRLAATEEPEESPLDKLSAKDLLKELEDDRTADVEAREGRRAVKPWILMRYASNDANTS